MVCVVIDLWRNIAEKNCVIKIVGDGEKRTGFTNDIVDVLIKIPFSNEYHEDAW